MYSRRRFSYFREVMKIASSAEVSVPPGGGGGTFLLEAYGDEPLDGIAFSRLD